jgi:hypothetical protein
MYGWILAVLYIFQRFPPQRALIVSFIVAWDFLPMAEIPMSPFPPYTKMAATCYGILLATFIYDAGRFGSFKPSWLDLPMLIWCLCPLASQFTNGGSPISPTFNQIVTWGIPYFLGRIYLNNLEGLRQLAIGIFAGGAAYMPLCLIENVKGPVLHQMVYRFNSFNDWSQARRYGGWRPVVFMQHGLMVGMWMMAAALIGIWLWQTGVIKKLWIVPVKPLAIMLTISFVLCLSTGAYIYMVLGLVFLFAAKWLRTAFPVLLLIGSMSFYLYVGATGSFSSDQIIASLSQVFPEDRIGSLKFRFDNEEILGQKARQKMLFGWGDSGGNRVYDSQGRDVSTTDSLWIIAFGWNGIVGLTSLMASLLLPVVSFCFSRFPASTWSNRKVAPAAVLAIALVMYVLDSILNAMVNPVFALISGGISGLVLGGETATSTNKETNVRSSAPRRPQAQRDKRNQINRRKANI